MNDNIISDIFLSMLCFTVGVVLLVVELHAQTYRSTLSIYFTSVIFTLLFLAKSVNVSIRVRTVRWG